jgi:signal transduction histidine kinase
MAQLGPNERANGKTPAKSWSDDRVVNGEILRQRQGLLIQMGKLSSLIENYVQDLSQPMTVVLGLSDLLLPHIEADNPLATDLDALTEQVQRMGQKVQAINELVEQRNKLLKILVSPQSGFTSLGKRATGNHTDDSLMR